MEFNFPDVGFAEGDLPWNELPAPDPEELGGDSCESCGEPLLEATVFCPDCSGHSVLSFQGETGEEGDDPETDGFPW